MVGDEAGFDSLKELLQSRITDNQSASWDDIDVDVTFNERIIIRHIRPDALRSLTKHIARQRGLPENKIVDADISSCIVVFTDRSAYVSSRHKESRHKIVAFSKDMVCVVNTKNWTLEKMHPRDPRRVPGWVRIAEKNRRKSFVSPKIRGQSKISGGGYRKIPDSTLDLADILVKDYNCVVGVAGSGHLFVEAPGVDTRYFMSKTQSDRRAVLNAAADIKRILGIDIFGVGG